MITFKVLLGPFYRIFIQVNARVLISEFACDGGTESLAASEFEDVRFALENFCRELVIGQSDKETSRSFP